MAGGPKPKKRHNKNRIPSKKKKKTASLKQKRQLIKVTPPLPSTPEVPPAYLTVTASPFVYVASCALEEHDIDASTLFAGNHNEEQATLPAMFTSSRFDFVNPKSVGNQLDTWKIPEVAFLGRSNVGKSSLINAVMRRNLARCSKHPGRTQDVYYFALVDNAKLSSANYSPSQAKGFLVDLPGYGYARAPETKVDQWQKNTQAFFLNRRDAGTMRNVFLLIDARRGTAEFDRTVMAWFDEASIPYTIILTKADKVGRPQLVRFVNEVCMRYHAQIHADGLQDGTQGAIVHITSSKTGQGIHELMESIETDLLPE